MIERCFQYVREKIADIEWLTYRVTVESECNEDGDIGLIGGSLAFKDGSVFHFKEVFIRNVRKYRFHYMDSEYNLILRWDNAPHHRAFRTYPHHIHFPGRIEEHEEISFAEALVKIEDIVIEKLDEF